MCNVCNCTYINRQLLSLVRLCFLNQISCNVSVYTSSGWSSGTSPLSHVQCLQLHAYQSSVTFFRLPCNVSATQIDLQIQGEVLEPLPSVYVQCMHVYILSGCCNQSMCHTILQYSLLKTNKQKISNFNMCNFVLYMLVIWLYRIYLFMVV